MINMLQSMMLEEVLFLIIIIIGLMTAAIIGVAKFAHWMRHRYND